MKKTDNNLAILRIVFAVSLVVANVVTAKLIYTGIYLFGTNVTFPGAVVSYAITYLATDVIGELWGKAEANKTVLYGFVGQIIATLLIVFTSYLPAADPSMQGAYDALLGQNGMFVTGSLVAYFASQSWDVWIFHKIRDRYIQRYGSTKGGRWIWNNASTMTSQIIDTALFIGVSFGVGFGWLFDKTMWPALAAMVIGQYTIKFVLAALDTPIFYLLTRRR